jgi:hypothetical protein
MLSDLFKTPFDAMKTPFMLPAVHGDTKKPLEMPRFEGLHFCHEAACFIRRHAALICT